MKLIVKGTDFVEREIHINGALYIETSDGKRYNIAEKETFSKEIGVVVYCNWASVQVLPLAANMVMVQGREV